jgi:hypothetical protein
LERGGLIMVGLGPTVPPLNMEIDGEFDNVPLGQNLSKTDLEKSRAIKLNNIHIHSPLDLAVTLLRIESVVFEFHMGGIRNRQLDSLIFNKPRLDIDRGFFWFVDELRRSNESKAPSPPSNSPEWKVGLFKIIGGELDINRLREISIQYPFGFETTKKDMPLRNLSLADFAIDLDIPQQDLEWAAKEISFKNIRGKIAFNLDTGQKKLIEHEAGWHPANDMVNTLYVDAIHWKKLVIDSGWITLTFDPKAITSSFGGSFADGYVDGGISAGWSGNEPWRVWGSAADVNAKIISDAFSGEYFVMNGRAGMTFDVHGEMKDLQADMKLNSLTTGEMEIRSLDTLLEKVDKNTIGMRKELLNAFISSLRNYPYLRYDLDLHYEKPDAKLTLHSDSDFGSRQLDVYWHGVKN